MTDIFQKPLSKLKVFVMYNQLFVILVLVFNQ